MHTFVFDRNEKPLTPCRMARARILLKLGRAAVFRRFPFTIILTDRLVEESPVHEHRIKIDPGSKTTGVAVLQETGQVVAAVGVHRFVKLAKGRSSRFLRQEFSWLKSRLPTLWTNSSAVLTGGGAPLAVIKKSIENQKRV